MGKSTYFCRNIQKENEANESGWKIGINRCEFVLSDEGEFQPVFCKTIFQLTHLASSMFGASGVGG